MLDVFLTGLTTQGTESFSNELYRLEYRAILRCKDAMFRFPSAIMRRICVAINHPFASRLIVTNGVV